MAGLSVVLTCLAAALAYRNGYALIQLENLLSLVLVMEGLLGWWYSLLGALMASRRPRNPIGWIFCVGGLFLAVGWFAAGYSKYSLLNLEGSKTLGEIILTFRFDTTRPGIEILIQVVFLLLFLLFPNGRLPSRLWWPVAVLDVGALVLGIASLFRPGALHHDYPWVDNPLGISWLKPVMDITDRLVGDLYLLFFGLLVFSVASLADRYRLSGRETRQQIKWLAYAGVLAVFNVFWLLAGDYIPAVEPTVNPFAEWLLLFVLFVAVPLAVTIGILRYRLYDIDLLVSRTLVYGLLTAILALGYFGGVALLQELVDTLSDSVAGEQSQMVVVGTTLAIAALARPLRNRIQATIDRRFYRRRYDAARTVEEFAATLRDEVDLDTINADLLRVVDETVQPTHASLWLRPSGQR